MLDSSHASSSVSTTEITIYSPTAWFNLLKQSLPLPPHSINHECHFQYEIPEVFLRRDEKKGQRKKKTFKDFVLPPKVQSGYQASTMAVTSHPQSTHSLFLSFPHPSTLFRLQDLHEMLFLTFSLMPPIVKSLFWTPQTHHGSFFYGFLLSILYIIYTLYILYYVSVVFTLLQWSELNLQYVPVIVLSEILFY